MAILNYTTKIDPWKTVSEIQQILAEHGVSHFSVKNEGKSPVAISFIIDFKGQPLNFLLPCKFNRVWDIVKRDDKAVKLLKAKGMFNDEQGLKISWRIIKDWIEAQLALVEVEMVTVEEVFMPYLIINASGETIAQRIYQNDGLKLLN